MAAGYTGEGVGENIFKAPALLLAGNPRVCPQLHWEEAGSNGLLLL